MWTDAVELFLLGLTYNLTFCFVACNPLIVSYVLSSKKDQKSITIQTLIFSLTRSVVHFFLAILIYGVGDWLLSDFTRYSGIINMLTGGFIMTVGIFLLFHKSGEFCFLKHGRHDAMTLGLISGFSPCPPHVAAWSYIALRSRTTTHALVLAFSFALAEFIVPMLMGLGASKISKVLKNEWFMVLSKVAAFVLIYMGLKLAFK